MAPNQQKILFLVDDDKLMEIVFKEALKNKGLDLRFFFSPVAALDEFNKGTRPDLLVTDLIMPQIDGIQLIGEMRKKDWEKPAIIVSGRPDKESALRALELNVMSFLEKPFHDEELTNTVNQALYSSALLDLTRELMKKYEDLSRTTEELLRKYEDRCIQSENALFEAGFKGNNRSNLNYMKTMQQANELEDFIDQTKASIVQIKQQLSEIRKLSTGKK